MTRFPCGTRLFVYPAPEGPTPNPRHHCHSAPLDATLLWHR